MLNFYDCLVKILNNDEVDQPYDEEINITSEKDEVICDILLDKNIFAGVGYIIKNEALSTAETSPIECCMKDS